MFQVTTCNMPSSIEPSMGPVSTKLSPNKGGVGKSEGGDEGVYYAVYIPTELLGGYENEFSECKYTVYICTIVIGKFEQ